MIAPHKRMIHDTTFRAKMQLFFSESSIRKVENIVSLLTEIRYFYLIFLVFRWYEQ